jgi:hypothetical protein
VPGTFEVLIMAVFQESKFTARTEISERQTYVAFNLPTLCHDIKMKPQSIKVYHTNPFFFETSFSEENRLKIYLFDVPNQSYVLFGFPLRLFDTPRLDFTEDLEPFNPSQIYAKVSHDNRVHFIIELTNSEELFEGFELEFSALFKLSNGPSPRSFGM